MKWCPLPHVGGSATQGVPADATQQIPPASGPASSQLHGQSPVEASGGWTGTSMSGYGASLGGGGMWPPGFPPPPFPGGRTTSGDGAAAASASAPASDTASASASALGAATSARPPS